MQEDEREKGKEKEKKKGIEKKKEKEGKGKKGRERVIKSHSDEMPRQAIQIFHNCLVESSVLRGDCFDYFCVKSFTFITSFAALFRGTAPPPPTGYMTIRYLKMFILF